MLSDLGPIISFRRLFIMLVCDFWCAILIAHQLLWQNIEAPVSIFLGIHLRENLGYLARDCFTSTASTVTNSVQNIFTRLRYCDK